MPSGNRGRREAGPSEEHIEGKQGQIVGAYTAEQSRFSRVGDSRRGALAKRRGSLPPTRHCLVTPRPARLLQLAVLALAAGAASAQAPAVPPPFGSADDLFEFGTRDGDAPLTVGLFGGAAYLPDTWRAAARAEVAVRRGPFSAAAAQTLHLTAGGLYGPEADELYDVLRAVEFVRLDRTARQPLYARLGPAERVSLGAGALARSYRTTTAWDERTLGAEAALDAGPISIAAFTDDVRMTGVAGGEATLRTRAGVGPLGGLRLTLGAVHDLGLPARGDSALTGVEATLAGSLRGGRFAVDAPFAVSPFVTAAAYTGKGHTLGVGADVDAFRFSDALRARVRAAVFVSSARFLPGAVNPFYALSNADERIVAGLSRSEAAGDSLVGTPLDSLRGGVDVVLDVRIVAFGRFEASQYVRRHIGADRASAYGLRLAARLPRRARAELALERQGFRGLWSFLGGLGDENALVLDVTAPVGRGAQLFVRSRYGYRRLSQSGPDRFLAERRFEPLLGVRVALR